MLTFPCPCCDKELDAQESQQGRPMPCPWCANVVLVPGERVEEPAEEETKPCPRCREPIPADADKCCFCGEDLDDRAKLDGCRWMGDRFVLPLGEELPDTHCGVCGSSAEVARYSKEFWSVPTAALLGLLIGCAPGAFLILLLRRTATVRFPLCPGCRSRWSSGSNLFVAYAGLGWIVLPVALASVGALLNENLGQVWGAACGLAAYSVGILILRDRWLTSRQAICEDLDRSRLVLQMPDPAALKRVWNFPE